MPNPPRITGIRHTRECPARPGQWPASSARSPEGRSSSFSRAGLISDDGNAGTAFREDQWIRHPHDLGSRACPALNAPNGHQAINQTSRHYAEALAPAPPFLAETIQTADTTLSDNWSGYEVMGPSGQFTLAQAHYDEPTFGSSRCSTNEESTWAGIGGAHLGDPLGQAGTAHNEPGLANHQAWWKVVPDVNTVAINLTTAGHSFFASTRRITGGYQFFVENVATNTTQAVNAMINHYSGDSAEAIAERPTTSDRGARRPQQLRDPDLHAKPGQRERHQHLQPVGCPARGAHDIQWFVHRH